MTRRSRRRAVVAVATAILATLVAAAPAGAVQPVHDTFDRADDKMTLGTTDTGQPWTAHHGVWGTDAGQATHVAEGYGLATVDAGMSSGSAAVTVRTAGPELWLVLRLSSSADHWRFGRWRGEAYQLQKITHNTVVDVPAVRASVQPVDGDVLRCELQATFIRCSVNGMTIVEVDDSFNQSATKFGFATYDATPSQVRFDEFSVAPPASPPDLAVSLSAAQQFGTVDVPLDYRVDVANGGGSAATAVEVRVPLTETLVYSGATPSAGTCTATASEVLCEVGTIASGSTVTVDVQLVPRAAGELPVSATATLAELDAVPADNTASTSTTVFPAATGDELVADTFSRIDSAGSLGYTDNKKPWTAHIGTWGVVANQGYLASSGYGVASVDAQAADGVATLRMSQVSSEFWLVFRLTDAGNHWRFGRWRGGTYELQQIRDNALVAQYPATGVASPAATDTLACELRLDQVKCSVNGVEAVRARNAFNQAATRVGLAAFESSVPSPARFDVLTFDLESPPRDLRASVTSSADSTTVGQQVSFRFRIGNAGAADATGVRTEMPIPPTVDLVSQVPSVGSCTVASGTAVCELGTVAAGGEVFVDVVWQPRESGSLTASLTASMNEMDPVPEDNVARHNVSVLSADAEDAKVVDTFARPDSPGLGTSDSGHPWTVHTGEWAITDNRAHTTVAGTAMATLDPGFAFGTLEATVAAGASANWGVVFRVTDANNYFRFGPDPTTGIYRVIKVVDGRAGEIEWSIHRREVTPANGDRIRIVLRPDDSVYVAVNGVHVFDGGDPQSLSVARFGFLSRATEVQFGSLVAWDYVSSGTVSDTFSRTDNGLGLGYPESGPRYQWHSPADHAVWGVDAGQAFFTGHGYSLVRIDSGTEQPEFGITVARAGGELWAVFRFASFDSYYRFGAATGGTYVVQKIVANAIVDIPGGAAVHATATPADGDRLLVSQWADGRVELRVNGLLTHSFVDAEFELRNTYLGMATVGSTARFDDFRAEHG